MKKISAAKESWGDAIFAAFGTLFFLIVAAALISLAVTAILAVWAWNPWVLAALAVPATLTLIYRYTPALKKFDEWSMGKDDSDSGWYV